MAKTPRDNGDERREPLSVADTDRIDQAAEPAAHPDAAGADVSDEVGGLLAKAEGSAW